MSSITLHEGKRKLMDRFPQTIPFVSTGVSNLKVSFCFLLNFKSLFPKNISILCPKQLFLILGWQQQGSNKSIRKIRNKWDIANRKRKRWTVLFNSRSLVLIPSIHNLQQLRIQLQRLLPISPAVFIQSWIQQLIHSDFSLVGCKYLTSKDFYAAIISTSLQLTSWLLILKCRVR